MIKLAEIITTQDVETIFETIHAMVALVDQWNAKSLGSGISFEWFGVFQIL